MINAFVFAGLPTTIILVVVLAFSLIIFPCTLNIFALSNNKSARCMPLDLGLAPTNNM